MPDRSTTPETAQAFHISNLATSRFERSVAWLIALLLLAAACLVLPSATSMLPEIQAFLPLFIGIIFILDLVTAFLLFTEFRVNQKLPHAVLASAYLYSALMTVPHLLTFPGAFSTAGLLHASTQTATWLWVFWHGGFPLLLLLYIAAEYKYGDRTVAVNKIKPALAGLILGVAALVGFLTWVSIYQAHNLPTIIQKSNYRMLLTSGVGPAVWVLNIASFTALAVLLRGRTVVGLWATVASFAFTLDVTLTLFSGARYSSGWYAARLISLVAAGMVMGNILIGLRHLYYRAQKVNEERLLQADRLLQLNRRLQQDKERVQGILESTREGMLIFDGRGCIHYVNDCCRELVGDVFRAGEMLGPALERLDRQLQPRDLLESRTRRMMSGAVNEFKDHVSFIADGGKKHFEFYGSRIGDEDAGEESDFLLVLRDRTEEEQVNELKTELISVVSHELRTPLTSLLGFLEIMRNREIDAEKQKKYIATMHKEALRLTELINDFLDLQRMESGSMQFHFADIDLREPVLEIAEQWDGRMSHRIRVVLPADSVTVSADADRIKQVLHNLISNAVKYSPGAEQVNLSLSVDSGQARLQVRDFGLGIPADARPHLFTKFYRVDNSDRRKIGGTGLGLSIVKDIIETHQGNIEFESEMGAGTTFTVTLPLHP